VKSLSGAARGMGVTDGQSAETLRIAYMISGNGTLGTMQAAFDK